MSDVLFLSIKETEQKVFLCLRLASLPTVATKITFTRNFGYTGYVIIVILFFIKCYLHIFIHISNNFYVKKNKVLGSATIKG